MAATTCARSSSDIFFKWYVLSSCLSSCFRNLTHAAGWRPMRNRPGVAPRGGLGDGGRHPSSSSATYAVLISDPMPVPRSNCPLPFFGLDAEGAEGADTAVRASPPPPEFFFIHLGFFHSLPSASALSLPRYASATA